MSSSSTGKPFVHLRNCTAYSPLEGAISVSSLIELCREQRAPAVGIADSNNLFGALEFSLSAARAGIQPIIGSTIGFEIEADSQDRHRGHATRYPPLVLFAQTEEGYGNLLRLVSDLYLDSDGYHPRVRMEKLRSLNAGLICLTGGAYGPVGSLLRDGRQQLAASLVRELARIFHSRLYMEIQRHGIGDQPATATERSTEKAFLGLAYEERLPLVATNESYFPERDFYEAHQVLLAIRPGSSGHALDEEKFTTEHYFKPAMEMRALFDDLPEAIANTLDIARRCSFRPTEKAPNLPRFAENEVEELREIASRGLKDRLQEIVPAEEPSAYEERLAYELDVIESMQYSGYFLIVADFVNWARKNEVPVGPGRGSGAGSLVAFALRITNLDPIRYGLLFERFLNPERISMPDFDIDFCEDRRDEVLGYVRDRYGADRVAKIITFGSLQARAAIRDVGRALGVPYGQTDRIAKLIPVNPTQPITLGKAYKMVPEFRQEIESEEQTRRMYEIAVRLEGLYRNVSIHAAGIVIGDRPLVETVPLYKDRRSEFPATQFTMAWAEASGLVKFDFLGLKTLTALQEAVGFLRERDIELDISAIPLDDSKTFELYSRAETVGVFQVEGEGMRDALRRLCPDRFEDIIAMVALYRPGPMDNIPKFCAIKSGHEDPERYHPKIEPILRETYGIIVYQEQVMEIAKVLAGYELGQADILRRAMGKKKADEMRAQKENFLNGLSKNSGMDSEQAERIYELVAKFADYGFNKSHAAAYALVSYQTAYMKANYPVEFFAVVMNSEISGQDQDRKLAAFRDDAVRVGIEVLAPCVNRSFARFVPRNGSIPYALGAIKGVSAVAVRSVEAARMQGGEFLSIGDFVRRVDLAAIGKGALESLIRAGAFDSLRSNRQMLLKSLPDLMRYSQDYQQELERREATLFDKDQLEIPDPILQESEDFPPNERYEEERKAVGFLISGHPLDMFENVLRFRGIDYCSAIRGREKDGSESFAAGMIASVDRRRSQRGNSYARIVVSDPHGSETVMVFADALRRVGDVLVPGAAVMLVVGTDENQRGRSLICRRAEPLEQALAKISRRNPGVMRITMSGAEAAEGIRQVLHPLKSSGNGAELGMSVQLILELPGKACRVEMALDGSYMLTLAVEKEIRGTSGVRSVQRLTAEQFRQ